jgi:hypothetical protein
VRDETGPVAGALVLVRREGETVAELTADESGEFRLDGVSPGEYELLALHPQTNRTGRRELVVEPGVPALADVTLTPSAMLGTVHVTGFLEATGERAADAEVTLFSSFPGWTSTTVLDQNGEATFTGIPPGDVSISSGAPPDLGWDAGRLPEGGSLDLVLRIGERYWFPITLTGDPDDEITAAAYGEGDVRTDGSCTPFCGTYARLQSVPPAGDEPPYFPARAAGRVLQDGREVANGPGRLFGLEIERRQFVPVGGRFIRFLDVIRNPTTAAVTVTYDLEQYLSMGSGTWLVDSTSSGDTTFGAEDQYAVVTHDDDLDLPAIAFVLGGPQASVPHGELQWNTDAPNEQWYRSTWPALTLQPGQTVILMQFLVQKPGGAAAEALGQAQALASLTDPDALAGLSPQERAAIVNFLIP